MKRETKKKFAELEIKQAPGEDLFSRMGQQGMFSFNTRTFPRPCRPSENFSTFIAPPSSLQHTFIPSPHHRSFTTLPSLHHTFVPSPPSSRGRLPLLLDPRAIISNNIICSKTSCSPPRGPGGENWRTRDSSPLVLSRHRRHIS